MPHAPKIFLLFFICTTSTPELLYSMDLQLRKVVFQFQPTTDVSVILPPNNMPPSFEEGWEWPITWKYKPLKMPNDPSLKQKRAELKPLSLTPENVLRIFPNTVLAHIAPIGERPGVCYHDAMRRTLGLTDQQFKQLEQSMVGRQDWVQIIGVTYRYFNQKKNPKPGYLATYTSKGNDFKILHVGVVTENNKIRSKFAVSNYTYDHNLWDLPKHWGNRIRFWRLDRYYQIPEGKISLFTTLKWTIEHSTEMKKRLYAIQQCLLTSNSYNEHYNLIKGTPGLDINVRHGDGRTALMLAAANNNFLLVKLYTEHHAAIDLRDDKGRTAFMLAVDNYCYNIIEYLLDHGADPEPYNKYLK